MQILQELDRAPQATQRDLSKRIGVALGLTNLILRRLITKGYIKITGTKRNRILYLITPKGLLEKSRLTYEYIEYSLQYYRGVRQFLRERLEFFKEGGHQKILLFGTGELAEIAYLTIQELGLELIGVIAYQKDIQTFLQYPVQGLSDISLFHFDGIIVASLKSREAVRQNLLEAGVPSEKIIMIPDRRVSVVRPTLLQKKEVLSA